MVHILPVILSKIFAFREVDQKMEELSLLRVELRKIVSSNHRFTYISHPLPGEKLSYFNERYSNKGFEVCKFFRLQDEMVDICRKNGFGIECVGGSYFNLNFDYAVSYAYKTFLLASDDNFNMYVDLRSMIKGVSDHTLHINLYVRPKSDTPQEMKKLSRVELNFKSVDEFVSVVRDISFNEVVTRLINKYEKEIRVNEKTELVRDTLPLLKGKYL